MKRKLIAITALLGGLLVLAGACNKKSPTTSGGVEVDPTDFVQTVDNPYWPLVPGTIMVYDGEEDGERERVITEVLSTRRMVAGVSCVVVRDRVWVDEEFVEDTHDWYAQHVDGDVYYFGEDVKNYEDGELVDNDGAWEWGVDGAVGGVLVPADPVVGEVYQQEYYEGEAEDMIEILSTNATANVAYGDFTNCLHTKDWTPLEPGVVAQKYFAPGVGTVRELILEGGSGDIELMDILPPENRPPASEFTHVIDNPYCPYPVGRTKVFEEVGGTERIEVWVTGDTQVVQGVTCRVVRDRVYDDGELIEDTLDWYAQHDNGDVWYFGEDVKHYENGVFVSTEGSWEAGVDGARSGVLIPAAPDPLDGDWYQEFLAGVAEDKARVVAVGESITIDFGTFDGCLRTYEWSPMEPDSGEENFYAPGIGRILEGVVLGDERVELVEIIDE